MVQNPRNYIAIKPENFFLDKLSLRIFKHHISRISERHVCFKYDPFLEKMPSPSLMLRHFFSILT